MRKPRFALALLLLLGLGASQAVPAEDLPETAYDESETLPYERTPPLSITVTQSPERTAKVELRSGYLLRFNSAMKRCQLRREETARSHRVPDYLAILNHSLRC
jgi:hypothetical protein